APGSCRSRRGLPGGWGRVPSGRSDGRASGRMVQTARLRARARGDHDLAGPGAGRGAVGVMSQTSMRAEAERGARDAPEEVPLAGHDGVTVAASYLPAADTSLAAASVGVLLVGDPAAPDLHDRLAGKLSGAGHPTLVLAAPPDRLPGDRAPSILVDAAA